MAMPGSLPSTPDAVSGSPTRVATVLRNVWGVTHSRPVPASASLSVFLTVAGSRTVPFDEGKTRSLLGPVTERRSSTASPKSGRRSVRRDDDVLGWSCLNARRGFSAVRDTVPQMVSVPASRSTSSHRRARTSPMRAPVAMRL